MQRLLKVEDTFLIEGRGLVVVPGPAIEDVRGSGDISVELRCPDGTRLVALLNLSPVFQTPPPLVHRWACIFRTLRKEDVPVGTEIWCDDDVFL